MSPLIAAGLGVEWMPIAAILLPILILILIVWLGSRNTV